MSNNLTCEKPKLYHRLSKLFFILHVIILCIIAYYYNVDIIVLSTVAFILGGATATFKVAAILTLVYERTDQ
jgi:hypothetical protein